MRATILLLVACLAVASAQTTFTSLADAVRAANASAPNLSILLAAVQAAGVGSALTPNTTWTILAPDNAAFTSRLNESLGITPQQLLLPENRETLVQVLSYHVIPSAAVLSSQLTDGQNLTTALAGAAPLRVRIADGNVTFIGAATNATVIGADIRAGASVIHVIDDVLLPAAPAGNDTAENATAADGAAEPPMYASIGEALTAANTSATNLTILLAAVQAAGIAANLTNATAWTILAPDNAAFTSRLNASLGITPQQLLLPENRQTLVQVLSYHVIPAGAVFSSNLTDGQNVTTALTGGAPLRVRIANGSVTFVGPANNATVKAADITAGASVIHVIDDVLLPEAAESAPNVTAAQGPAAAAPAASPAAARSGASAAAAATGLLTVLLGAAVALLA
uniref:FAS1 domain-containing protein n=1 Tax=Tetradesmus obliquus TaxID=3088 RepID=A0A383WMA0_TETOB|eukprot:jgi/Sobl393_1/17371/SZX76824.1